MTASAGNRAIAVPAVGVRIEQVNLSYGDNHVLKSIDLDIRPASSLRFSVPPAAARPRCCG
ncbi:ABC-type transporter Mla maintaining outer membrane lipid asymmetry ATPase subunit MlaF [Bradyrhizobium sp. OAE829]